MDISKICSIGYFDKVIVDGYTMTMFSTKGLEITRNETFENLMKSMNKYSACDIVKVRVTIYGESDFNMSDDKLLSMREHRELSLKLSRILVNNNDRYALAYVDILVIKSNSHLSYETEQQKMWTREILNHMDISEDEYTLLDKAIEIKKNNSIGVLDKVYVNKSFRKCKISSWIHENIFDIIKSFGMCDVSAVLLIPGDFSNESESEFGYSKREYRNMLVQHYKSVGYKFISKDMMCKYKNKKRIQIASTKKQ